MRKIYPLKKINSELGQTSDGFGIDFRVHILSSFDWSDGSSLVAYWSQCNAYKSNGSY